MPIISNNHLRLFIAMLAWINAAAGLAQIRPPQLAGTFYDADPVVLRQSLAGFFATAGKPAPNNPVLAILAPHAGYAYCGKIAATSYAQIKGQSFDIIVILSPSHRDDFTGATIYPGEAYSTPLGKMMIDKELAARLVDESDLFRFSELGHRMEHSLEVQIPYLQYMGVQAKIVPLVIGRFDWQSCKKMGEVIANVLGRKKCLLIASSDLYHGYSTKDCELSDSETLQRITSLRPEQLCREFLSGKIQACGAGPIVVTEVAALKLGTKQAKLLSRTNSAEVTGQMDRYVVGYGGVVFYADQARIEAAERIEFQPLPIAVQKDLLIIAREAITGYLKNGILTKFTPVHAIMNEKRGVFVTITEKGILRGCIGYHEANQPLIELVPDRAIAAATQDPRFPPITLDELSKIKIKISVYLTNVYPVASLDEFEMGTHGIIMMKNGRGATYLPEVPLEAGWSSVSEEMVSLCQKAGLPSDAWRSGASFWLYRTQVFDESILEREGKHASGK